MAKKQIVPKGKAYIKASYNNTFILITDNSGNGLVWSSAGSKGFKGPKKATPYAASIVAEDIIAKLKPFGMKEIDILVKGIGHGRESAIRSLNAGGLKVKTIQDVTPVPHNGPRPPKPRRV
ncbi:MAG: 30S ribosomal protein S11 [Candidatus Jacksonbacteria bacterium RIFOXYC2_FULL_44_29]|nr:MAG: Ribosomal protein S11 [Parcubacteria group bacterium GW2011_GWA2_42_28]KKT55450.1 MAG: Ribosomal protein S11 [Parcubacteria group bacterium GW2011_GWC2_44_22]OGY75240.1 MAG: 30S ribosomal protein S11 [Candidatus Jacksonbacteria bacterium RIFOXYA2_FULL_43_12]OGY75943.1 MAG: 30S ribosomal protein S11 [Candidatus Jacksonbacteria bacterium RIFOXYB2_FULL_44_15]OGY77958.1 MAG: 30S ribosomal protein S11 [Candidatus Jacksonbacteria bacterium RIFOXYC2_FULL_44_29]OGY80544.1 MAG: 30S ribosomal pr